MCGIGDFDDKDKVVTIHYKCTKCKNACDVHNNERKVWIRNPATKIIPNKKNKSSTKLTAKELREIHQTQDF
jgi:hypothetical protein